MAKTSDLMNHMEDIDDILSNLNISGTSGTNQTRALVSLNRSQDLMERFIGREPDLLTTVDDTISQTVGQEYTALPSRTIRIDSVWFLSGSTSLPEYEISVERKPGGHRQSAASPLFDVVTGSASTGKPNVYWWARGSDRLYWDRQPDTTNSIRIVGFFGASDMTITSDSTFAYDDAFIIPICAVAAEIFRIRRRDDWQELQTYADKYFQPVVDQMSHSHPHQLGELRGSFPSW